MGGTEPACARPGCNRCRRLRAGAVEALARRRGTGLTVAQIARHAGVPAEAFELHYRSVEDCLLATLDEALVELCDVAERAFAGPGSWHLRVHAAVAATLAEFAARPGLRWLFFEELTDVSTLALAERRVSARARYARVFASAFGSHGGDSAAPDVCFEFLVGAGYRAIREQMLAGGDAGVVDGAARARELTKLIAPPRARP